MKNTMKNTITITQKDFDNAINKVVEYIVTPRPDDPPDTQPDMQAIYKGVAFAKLVKGSLFDLTDKKGHNLNNDLLQKS